MLVKDVRRIEKAIGSAVKVKQSSEEACHQKLGKSVVTSMPLSAGTRLRREHLAVKVGHPIGWPPQHIDQLYGQILSKDMAADKSITTDCLQ